MYLQHMIPNEFEVTSGTFQIEIHFICKYIRVGRGTVIIPNYCRTNMDNLYELYEHFRSYIKDFSMKIENSTCSISHTPFAYDLIDNDLDFDEEYYDKMMRNFDTCLLVYVRDMLKSNSIKKVNIRKYKMLFRNESVLEYEKQLEACGNKCMIVTTVMEDM